MVYVILIRATSDPVGCIRSKWSHPKGLEVQRHSNLERDVTQSAVPSPIFHADSVPHDRQRAGDAVPSPQGDAWAISPREQEVPIMSSSEEKPLHGADTTHGHINNAAAAASFLRQNLERGLPHRKEELVTTLRSIESRLAAAIASLTTVPRDATPLELLHSTRQHAQLVDESARRLLADDRVQSALQRMRQENAQGDGV